MRSVRYLVALLALVVAASARELGLAKDAPSYPEGASMQTLDGHPFDLVVPRAADAKPPYSILVVITAAGTDAEQFLPLAKDGWVVVMPKQKFPGMWATSETKDVLDDVDAVAGACSVAKNRMHCLAIHDTWGFASFVAYDKRETFTSMSYADSEWSGVGKGRAPPADARRRLGVLLMGEGTDPARFADPGKITAGLAEKVRTAEYRRDEGPFKPYFRYWLGVMDGRFKPGHDLSFPWIEEAPPPPPAKPGEKPAAPPASALDAGKTAAKTKNSPAFVYFWSADDAALPDAKALQNEVFFDAEVRAAAKPLVAVKLERARYPDAFAALGLKATPAVLVVDPDFAVLSSFEGAISAKALAKALGKTAPTKPR